MSPSDVIGLISGGLQFAVACYALRLNRLAGTSRVGWSLFTAFALLALLHLLLSVEPFRGVVHLGVEVDVVYSLTSVLLLTGMANLETLLKERFRVPDLAKANVELQQTALKLQAEVDERKRMQEQMEKTHKELLTVSRQAGMSEAATSVLHNVGNVLNSVNVSASLVAEHLAQSKISNVARIASLMREHAADLGDFITRDPKGSQLPDYLTQLSRHLADEQSQLIEEVDFVKKKIEHIKEIVATQQNYGRVSGLAEKVNVTEVVEDVLRIHAGELAQHQVQLRREYDPRLPEIIVDKHKVLQVLLNLLSNAKQACAASAQEDRQVTVRVTNGDDRVCVAMSDNGVGIPAANLNKIFNHGFTTKKKGGHGFGLHSGALAAKEMGGTLVAHSDGPGRGATFTLELPLQPKTLNG